jgi:hypothetical protein
MDDEIDSTTRVQRIYVEWKPRRVLLTTCASIKKLLVREEGTLGLEAGLSEPMLTTSLVTFLLI